MSAFELAGGSTIGRDHRVIPRNNQDSYAIARSDHATVAVICDGCGSGSHSEVGAAIGARLISESVLTECSPYDATARWSLIEENLLSSIGGIADVMSSAGRYRQTLRDYFLFTTIGVLITETVVMFFGCGDGVLIVDGDADQLGPYPNNEPPYLAYQLLGDTDFDREELSLRVFDAYPVSQISSFLIGCDGAGYPGLLQACDAERTLPGMSKPVGPISQFWEGDVIFTNPQMISRRLKLLARDWPPKNPEMGLLADDTTIIVGRRVALGGNHLGDISVMAESYP